MKNGNYLQSNGIWMPAELNTIPKKEREQLQPLFEAFTNSLESIMISKRRGNSNEPYRISVTLFLLKNLLSEVIENELDFGNGRSHSK